MMRGLRGKVALVTGAASGVGRATALRLAREGAKVVIVDLDETGLHETDSLIKVEGGEVLTLKVDISSEAEVKGMIESVTETYGALHIAVNNAAILGGMNPLHKVDVSAFDRVLNVNLRGTFLCLKYEIEAMLGQGGGSIVNVSSIAGLGGQPMLSPYAASKHGVNGLTRTAALEYIKQGIRINAVNPGGIKTAMAAKVGEEMVKSGIPITQTADPHPIGRSAEPEEIASVVVFLASEEASDIVGQTLAVDGGMTAS